MQVSDYAKFIMSLTIWREMSSYSNAWPAVAWVIKNRANGPVRWWGNTIVEVCIHPYQFSSMTATGDSNLRRWPEEGDAAFRLIRLCVDDVLAGTIPDPTYGACYYYSPPLSEPPPTWGRVEESFVVGRIHFFRQLPPEPPLPPSTSTVPG